MEENQLLRGKRTKEDQPFEKEQLPSQKISYIVQSQNEMSQHTSHFLNPRQWADL